MFTRFSCLRGALADTFARVIYCLVMGMAIDILISSMSRQ
ncbi:L-alanine exporter AlaE [Lonsdalea quercina]